MSQTIQAKRVLAIDPTTRGFGFAVLEGPQSLVDWGVKEAKHDKNGQALKQVVGLIERYQPEVILLEDYTDKGFRRCLRVKNLIARILKLALERGVRIRTISRAKVREAFAQHRARTKHEIATAIASQLPELAPRLPPFRKPWMPEDYRMSIFDAVAYGLAFFYSTSKRSR